MVRAILEGRKTQTRRIMKPQPSDGFMPEVGRYHPTLIDRRTGEMFPGPERFGASDGNEDYPCPYGQPGDKLWVRETFALTGDNASTIVHPEHGGAAWRATDHPKAFKWKPSIFMPRWASRITLEITGIRVERLQEITPQDAIAEGHPSRMDMLQDVTNDAARDWFEDLWIDINGLESWQTNPFVWVVEFKKIKP